VGEVQAEHARRVTPFELFFDLVFVFGLTQVTTFLADDATWHGLARTVLVLSTLWWSWAGYAWLTNTVEADQDAVLAALFLAMAAMFVAALVVPTAFGSHALLFGVAFLVVNLMHITLYALAARDDPDLLRGVLLMARSALAGAILILLAAFVSDDLKPIFWVAALVVGLFGPLLVDANAWRLQPAHFVERHSLVIIIALGESLIAVGLGTRQTSFSATVIIAALLGLTVATSFWVVYFDFFTVRFEQVLTRQRGAARIALARDAYTYLHLPMVVGIVLTAFAMRTAVAHTHHDLDAVSALALCGGSALYLSSYVAMRWRAARTLGRGRPTASIAFIALYPVAIVVPAIAALALVTATWVGLHAYEILWYREARSQARGLRRSAPAQ
jgi:low temperature requirement protein LtrA